jgi:hypothetical protein
MSNKIIHIFLVVVFTFLSGFGDAQGFLHASKIWDEDKLVLRELGKSAAGYAIGILFFWIAIRFLNALGINSSPLQTIGWFTVTIVGVAILSGDFIRWQMLDKVLGIIAITCVAILLYRTGG